MRKLIYWSIELMSYCIGCSDTKLLFDIHESCIEVMSKWISYRYILSTYG